MRIIITVSKRCRKKDKQCRFRVYTVQLPRSVCPDTQGHYGILKLSKHIHKTKPSQCSFLHNQIKVGNHYRKVPKYSDTQKLCCNHSKIWTMWLYHRVTSPNDADGKANSVDPDQTAPLVGAVWSGSALFAQAYLSENLGSLRYNCWSNIRPWKYQSVVLSKHKYYGPIVFHRFSF